MVFEWKPKKEDISMKKASKIFFGLGVATTLGVATVAYVIGKERAKTPEDLLESGKELVRDTKDAIEDEVEMSLNNETNEEKNARHLVKSLQRATKDVGHNVKKGIDEVTDEIHAVTDKIIKKNKNEI